MTDTHTTSATQEFFRPFLPRLALEWEARTPNERARVVEASLLGLDISGFTALSERLAARGKAGAEELITLISRCYSGLIDIGARYGGDTLKFRGDALLLLFTGDGHETRAAHAALTMQAFIAENASAASSVGPVRLGMAGGIASGPTHLFFVGKHHKELVVCGPNASATLQLEDDAETGEVLMSSRTAEALPSFAGAKRGDAFVVRADVQASALLEAIRPAEPQVPDAARLVPPSLRVPIETGAVEAEHRHAVAAFVKFKGTDTLVGDVDEAARSLGELAATVSEVTEELGITWLESDIDSDGGKLYLVAGAPASAGGDEERMLRAARRIVDAHVGPPISIGMNRGPVLAGPIGAPARRTYAVMGDTVNLAARLAARAETGEILATGDVLQRSRTRFETSARQFLMKGKAKPVTGFSVGLLDEAHEIEQRPRLPLVGRSAELDLLRSAVDAARLRESRAVELVGEPGIGKSRLVEELATLALGFQTLEARCEQYASATPFAPLRALLRPLVGIVPDEPAAGAGQKLTAFVTGVMPDLAPWLPLLALPFDAEVEPTPEVDEIDPTYRRDRLHDVLEQMLSRLLLMPTVVLVEDAHWMDDASQLIVRRLAQPGARPWLVCITRRPGGPAIAGEAATVVELEPLAEDDARTLALAEAGESALSEDQLAGLTERAGGNPLFVRELVATSSGDDALPESVETLLTARIDTLPPEDRLLLRHAAVLGRSFDLDLLAAILPEEQSADPERWRRLGEFVEWDGPSLRFRHDLVRAAAYEGLSFAVRREIHRRVGEVLEWRVSDAEDIAALLSLHFFEAGEHDKSWAYSVAAADDARTKFANVDAAILYERALRSAEELTPDDAAVARVAESLGDVCELSARYERAESAYEHAASLAPDTTTKARLLRKQGIVRERSARYDEAGALYTAGLGLDGVADEEIAELELAQAILEYRRGRLDECVALTVSAAERAKAVDYRRGLARAYYVRAAAEGDRGGPASELLQLALSVYEEIGDVVGIGTIVSNLGVRAFYEGRWNDASELYAQGGALARRAGDVVMAANATNNEGEIRLDQGAVNARELLEEGLRAYRAAGYSIGAAFATLNLGRLAARSGDFAEGRRLMHEAEADFAAIGSGSLLLEARARLAEAYVLEGDHVRARELAAATLEETVAAGEVGVRNAMLERLIGIALVQARAPEAARPHLAESLRIARELGASYEEALTLKALAATGLGDAENADEILERLGVVAVPAVPLP